MDQAVTDKRYEDQRSDCDRLTVRLRRLQGITSADGYDVDASARRAMAILHETGERKPTHVLVRRGFVRNSLEIAPNVSDRRLPPPAERPPIARLISPRGVALRAELLLLFAAQCAKNRQGRQPVLQIQVEASRAEEVGLLDLVACVADHKRGTTIAVNRKDNRLRQIKAALDRLAEPGLGLVSLPNAGRARGKYDDFKLRDENGDRPVGAAVEYAVPPPREPHVPVPADFFLNGWVHALTDSEIAAWLMFRDLTVLSVPESERAGVHLSGEERVGRYGLSRDVWDAHRMLSTFGLLRVEAAPGRRPDGTFEDFRMKDSLPRHRFWVLDEALSQPAVPAVLAGVAAVLEESADS